MSYTVSTGCDQDDTKTKWRIRRRMELEKREKKFMGLTNEEVEELEKLEEEEGRNPSSAEKLLLQMDFIITDKTNLEKWMIFAFPYKQVEFILSLDKKDHIYDKEVFTLFREKYLKFKKDFVEEEFNHPFSLFTRKYYIRGTRNELVKWTLEAFLQTLRKKKFRKYRFGQRRLYHLERAFKTRNYLWDVDEIRRTLEDPHFMPTEFNTTVDTLWNWMNWFLYELYQYDRDQFNLLYKSARANKKRKKIEKFKKKIWSMFPYSKIPDIDARNTNQTLRSMFQKVDAESLLDKQENVEKIKKLGIDEMIVPGGDPIQPHFYLNVYP